MHGYVEARYEVHDVGKFLDEFARAGDMLRNYGFSHTWLHRNADEPTQVIVVHEASDLDRARQFYDSDEYRQCRQHAGVKQPRLTFMEELVGAPEPAKR